MWPWLPPTGRPNRKPFTMCVTCTAALNVPVAGRHAGEKDKARDKRENECKIVIDDEIREDGWRQYRLLRRLN